MTAFSYAMLYIKGEKMILTELDKLMHEARLDKNLKEQLIATQNADDPMDKFCQLALSRSYNITVGELLACGQDMNDSKLRSVNGGGVNGIDGWDDAYENFITTLIWTS